MDEDLFYFTDSDIDRLTDSWGLGFVLDKLNTICTGYSGYGMGLLYCINDITDTDKKEKMQKFIDAVKELVRYNAYLQNERFKLVLYMDFESGASKVIPDPKAFKNYVNSLLDKIYTCGIEEVKDIDNIIP